jgi:tetratricopeptide (TPR) repeat protein
MWGEKFDRELSEIFDVQDQVVQIIVGTLVGRVQAMDAERLRRKPPSSLAAYECVQRGNALPWDDPEAAAEATRLFEQAIELDPGYAMAYALLGTMYIGRYRNDPADATAALDEAYALTRRAVELDDGDSTCHSLLAHACLYRRSFDLALQHMRRSIEINPNNAWNRADMGLVLTYVGPAEEALSYLQQARQIDPYFGPGWYWRQKGQAYMVLGEFDNALAAFASIRSHTLRSRAYLAACCAQLGDEAQARVHASEVLSISPEFSTIQFMSKEPFRNPVNAEGLAAGLRAAGLPE